MVAYFALLSFVPLVFLALSVLGLAHRAEASSFFIRELKHAFPGTSLDSIIKLVRRVQDNAAAVGIIGGIGLIWSSLSFFSALESALNIVYGLPNRRFLHGKLLAAALATSVLVTLFASLVVGALGVSVLKHNLGAFADSPVLAYIVSIGASLTGVFLFLLAVYRWLPNTRVELQEALPGALVGAAVPAALVAAACATAWGGTAVHVSTGPGPGFRRAAGWHVIQNGLAKPPGLSAAAAANVPLARRDLGPGTPEPLHTVASLPRDG